MWKWWFTALRLVIKLLGRRNANGSLNVAVKWFWFNVFWQVLEALSSAAPRINSLSLPSSYVSLFEHTHTSSHSLPHTHTHTHTHFPDFIFSVVVLDSLSQIHCFILCVCMFLFVCFDSTLLIFLWMRFFFFFFWNSSLHPSHLLIMRRENWGCAERNSPPPTKKKHKKNTKT